MWIQYGGLLGGIPGCGDGRPHGAATEPTGSRELDQGSGSSVSPCTDRPQRVEGAVEGSGTQRASGVRGLRQG